MGTGASGRYGGTWGARRLAGEIVPGSAEAMRSAALLAAAAAKLGLSEDELLKKISQQTGKGASDLKAAMVGGIPADPAVLQGLDGLLEALLDGLAGLLGMVQLAQLLLILKGDVAQSVGTAAETTVEKEERERKPGIYENCLYAQEVTGETFYENDGFEGGHFGTPGNNGNTFEIQNCGNYVIERSAALAECLSRGAEKRNLIPAGIVPAMGVVNKLQDNTVVVYRWKTSTLDSPAVEINKSASILVKDHKVHFFSGASIPRKRGGKVKS